MLPPDRPSAFPNLLPSAPTVRSALAPAARRPGSFLLSGPVLVLERSIAVLLGSLFVFTTVVWAPGLEAQEEPTPAETIVSDRPGIGNGSYVLTPGVLQVEAGTSRSDEGPFSDYLVGELLLRFGLADRIDLRAGLGSVRFRRNGVSREGIEDVAPGVKVRIGSALDGTLTVSGLGAVGLPSGSDAFTADEATGTLAGLADWSLSDAFAVAVNVGYTTAFDDGHDDLWSVTVTPAHAFPGVAGLAFYGGWAGSFSDGSDDHVLEAGVTYLAGTEIQLDVNGGWDPDSDDFFVGIGIAHRWR